MKTNPDMRGRIVFPPRPATKEDIFNSTCPAWIIACSLVGKFDRWQVNTYRKLHGLIGDDYLYREIIDVTRVIFDESRNIIVPPAFLAAQFKLAAEGKGGVQMSARPARLSLVLSIGVYILGNYTKYSLVQAARAREDVCGSAAEGGAA